jgi:hypothetical protein
MLICMQKIFFSNTKFILTVDIDEFLWPTAANTTIKQLLNGKDTPTSGSIDFQSGYYFLQQRRNITVSIGHLSAIFGEGNRSKQALKPVAIYRQTVHLTWQYFPNFHSNYVPSSEAIVYHFRRSERHSVSRSRNPFAEYIANIVHKYHLTLD